jgi:hypothetical protein
VGWAGGSMWRYTCLDMVLLALGLSWLCLSVRLSVRLVSPIHPSSSRSFCHLSVSLLYQSSVRSVWLHCGLKSRWRGDEGGVSSEECEQNASIHPFPGKMK